MSRASLVSTDDCWLWAGRTSGSGHAMMYTGYDRVKHKNIAVMAYRAVYEALVGEIPDNMEIDHLCETPPCINPEHLEPVTHRENTLRYYRRRTHCRKGHEYTDDNIYWIKKKGNASSQNPTGLSRYCKACKTPASTGVQANQGEDSK